LVVDDEPHILATLAQVLEADFEVLVADCGEAAQQLFSERPIDLILTDQKMPRLTGVQLLEWVHKHYPKTIRLLMTGFADLEEAVEAINRGRIFRYLFKPWRAEALLENLQSAAHTFLLERRHEEVLEQLRQLNTELEERVAQRTKELEETNQELDQKNKMLEKLALTDPLTGLSNRRAMDRLAEREMRRRDRYPGPLSLALIDVDHFKEINARYLLPGGDKVLIDLGKVLPSSLRTVDLLGRIGGEEFLVIAPETGMEGARALGERIRSTVEKNVFTYKEAIIPVKVSIGFAVDDSTTDDGGGIKPDYEQMKHIAAAALSEAKNTGRNRCVVFRMPTIPFEAAG
jgi:diguanylate cyclase (GGDEF)-like protein